MRNAEEYDTDDDATIKTGALTDAQLAALDIPFKPGALTSELQLALRRLTPPAPRVETWAEPAAPRATHAVVRLRFGSLSLAALITIRRVMVQMEAKRQRWTWRLSEWIQRAIAVVHRVRERWEVSRALSFARSTRLQVGSVLGPCGSRQTDGNRGDL